MESRWTPKTSKSDFRGQNSMACGIFYIIGKLLERLCLIWALIAHLNIWNTSYGQKKGQETNYQFDSRTEKIRNRPNLLVYKQCVTYRWKALDKSYNFSLDYTSIRGLLAKLWGSKIAIVPTWAISIRNSHLGISRQKAIWMWVLWRGVEYTIRGKVVASPKSGPWWILCVCVAHGLS
jgi:hypothetical protein